MQASIRWFAVKPFELVPHKSISCWTCSLAEQIETLAPQMDAVPTSAGQMTPRMPPREESTSACRAAAWVGRTVFNITRIDCLASRPYSRPAAAAMAAMIQKPRRHSSGRWPGLASKNNTADGTQRIIVYLARMPMPMTSPSSG